MLEFGFILEPQLSSVNSNKLESLKHTLVGFTEPQCCGMFGHIVNVEPGLFVSQLISVKCESTRPHCIYMFSERAY